MPTHWYSLSQLAHAAPCWSTKQGILWGGELNVPISFGVEATGSSSYLWYASISLYN